jgi:tetratricopeptide (TPR) repeat protein
MKIVLKALIAVCLTAVFAFSADNGVQAAFDRGLAAADRGDEQEAIRQYTQAIKLNPNYASVYYNRGIAYANLGDTSKAIELNPNYTDAYINRGIAY